MVGCRMDVVVYLCVRVCFVSCFNGRSVGWGSSFAFSVFFLVLSCDPPLQLLGVGVSTLYLLLLVDSLGIMENERVFCGSHSCIKREKEDMNIIHCVSHDINK